MRKGHTYETLLMDAGLGAVMGMNHTRTYEATLDLLTKQAPSKDKVEAVVLDRWEPFHKTAKQFFPDTQVIIDKYHVAQKVTYALNLVRKKIPNLKKSRFLLMKSCEKLGGRQKEKLDALLEAHADLAYRYSLKE